MDKVKFSKVKKELRKIPSHVVIKLMAWAQDVELLGLREVRKI